jgi:hypothetical protein
MSDVGSHKWALVVAHPGHELRAFHFLERTRPLVSVLTDGSGSNGASRLHDTTYVLDRAGATCDTAYGCFTDAVAYAHLMARDATPFVDVAHRLHASFERHGITAVLTDAAEGYNPIHDLCRSIAEAAIMLCEPHSPLLFDFDLVGHPDAAGPGIRLTLDDGAFARKLAAVRCYAALSGEAEAAFERHGAEAFRTEFLRLSTSDRLAPAEHIPYYEHVGHERVREGRYPSVLCYGAHVRPVLEVLLSVAAHNRSGAALQQG